MGSARTFIFNWLYARRNHGTMILRLDDTDVERNTEASVNSIFEGLKWLGLGWDEEYKQSERGVLHRQMADAIFQKGLAYRDFTPAHSGDSEKSGAQGTWLFNPGTRELSREESDRRAAAGEPFALRFRVPREAGHIIRFNDAVYGEQMKAGADIEDFALLRSDGMPTYHLASCADDADLRISHIIRGQDHLSNTFKHDFNNLVMIIKGYSDMLLDSASPESRGHLEEIKRAGDRASGLTRQLLAFSRKQVLEPQVLDPNQTVRNMVKMLRVLIGEDIELVTNLSDQIGRVQADPGQLEQVVMNLAVNARDAMPGGGKLIIETQPAQLDEAYAAANSDAKAGDYVLIAVTDNGSGMSKETMAQIFEPFFTTKEQGKGTGLGLATVYGIVKQSRGHISVYSELGLGTTFKVYLPALASAASISAAQKTPIAIKGNGTVLLVEDEPALRLLAAAALKKLGYVVLEAANGVEALAAAESCLATIDIVVADVVMPHMGGPELVAKLRAKRGTLPVIFMSGYTEAAALEHVKLGADAALLNKPFSAEALAAKIQDIRGRNDTLSAKATASS